MSDGGLTRDILLRIRAQNLSTAEFHAAKSAVDQLTASLDKQIASANKAEITEKELTATLTKLEQASRNFTGIATAIDQFTKFGQVIQLSEQRVAQAATKLEQFRAKLAQTGDSGGAAATNLAKLEAQLASQQTKLQENITTYEQMGTALRKAGVDVNNLAVAEQNLKTAADQAGAAITKLNDAKLNLAENTRKAREEQRKLAEAQAAEAAAQRKAAEAYAQSLKIQEAAQVRAFQQFRDTEKARAEGHAKSIADVNAGVAAYRKEQEEKVKAAKAAADAQIAEEQRVAQRTREIAKQREHDALAGFRALQDRLRGVQQQPGTPAGTPTPLPGAGPRTDAMGRVGRGASAVPTLGGLRPYELTNLGYQVSDVFTGFASGQNALQILAQQGPQILQIFGTAALRWLPAVGVAATAAAVAIGVLNNGLRELASNREFEAILTANARAADQTAESLTNLRKEIRDMSIAWDDAGKLIKQTINANIRPELQRPFAELARNISRVEGVDVNDAMRDLIKGLTGGQAAIEDLIAKYPGLTEAQMRHVRALLEERRQGEAQLEVLRILGERYREADEKGTSPLRKATEALVVSWNHLIDTLTNSQAIVTITTRITGVIEKIDGLVKSIDDLLKKFDDPKWLLVRKILEGLSGPALPQFLTPGAPGSIVPNVPGATGTPGVPGVPGNMIPVPPGARFSAGQIELSTESLRQLAEILTRASAELPPGYRVEAISGFREGAKVAGTGEPSEHAGGRAIDVRIVDANGQPVPGSMGAGGPLYTQLDEGFKRIAAQMFPGVPVAIGSTFSRRPDAGHYSIGSEEAAANAARTGTQTGQTATQERDINRLIQAEKDRLAVMKAQSEQAEEAAIRATALREAQNTTTNEAQQNALVEARLEEFRYQRNKERFKEERDDAKQRIQDGRDFARIEEAGIKARAEALARNITNYKDLRAAQKEGEAEERALVERQKRESDELVAIKKQIASLDRENNQAYQTDLDRALEAVKQKYLSVYEAIKKARERQTTTDKADLDRLEEAARRAEGVATGRARIESAQASARASVQTRQELISTYNDLRAAGAIDIETQQRKIKEAFELTAPAIEKAAKELEAFLKTAEGLALPPEKIALITAQIQKLRTESKYVDPFLKGLRDTFSSSLGTGLETAFNTVAQSIGNVIAKTGEWKDVLTAVKQAGINLFSQLLRDIAGYIIKAQAAKLASSLFGVDTGVTGAAGSAGFGFLGRLLGFGSQTGAVGTAATGAATEFGSFSTASGAVLFHQGGIVGQGGVPALRPASWWENAPRYHNGSVIGMGLNEQAAILQRGEEVLTRSDPRHIFNGGVGGGRGEIAIRNVLVDDPRRIPEAMSGSTGERVIVQTLVKNAATIRELVRDRR